MAPRWRVATFGVAAALVLAGVLCAAAVGGVTGDVLAMALTGSGLLAAVSLAFLEVGLSEDRDRDRGEQRRRNRTEAHARERLRRSLHRRPRRRG
jgi:hypothetical protein